MELIVDISDGEWISGCGMFKMDGKKRSEYGEKGEKASEYGDGE